MHIKDQIKAAEKLLSKFKMPILPQAALDLQKLFSDSEMPCPKKIKQLISINPFLAGELVSLANLPSLSSSIDIRIKDIDGAIFRLGNHRLKNFIQSIYIKEMLSDFKIKGLSYHSQEIALISAEIARHNRTIRPDEAYLLGIVHDIGSFALSELDESYGETFVGKLVNHRDLEKHELSRYGTTHSALGYVIVRNWNMPAYIAQVTLLHHTHKISALKNNKLRNLIAIIELAHALSILKKNNTPKSPEALEMYHECQEILGLTDEQLNDIRLRIN